MGDARESLLEPPGNMRPPGEVFPHTRADWLANQAWLYNTYWPANFANACNRFNKANLPNPGLLPDPFITGLPQSQTVQDGDSVTFTLYRPWHRGPSISVVFNGICIPGATAASLTLNNVSGANAGYYTVTVSETVQNVLASANSDGATLTVNRREFVWVEDAAPAGATLSSSGADSWNNWVGSGVLAPFPVPCLAVIYRSGIAPAVLLQCLGPIANCRFRRPLRLYLH